MAEQAQVRRRRDIEVGLGLVIFSTLICATGPVLTRYGAVTMDPLLFSTGSVVVAAACAVMTLYLRGELSILLDPQYVGRFALLGLFGTAMTSVTLTYGLSRIGAISGVILLQTEPVFSLVLAMLALGERPSPRQLLATAAILAGIGSVLGLGAKFSPVWATALIAATPLLWQSAHVAALRVMPPLSPTCVTGARFVYGAAMLTPVFLFLQSDTVPQLTDLRALLAVVASGSFVYFLSSLVWFAAINRLSLAWTTALVVPGTPLLAIVFAVVFLGERISPREVAGIVIAIAGILALVIGSDPRRHPHAEALEAAHQPLA